MDFGDVIVEILVDTPLEVCEARDPVQARAKVRKVAISHFTGDDSAYEAPVDPEIHLTYQDESAQETVERLFDILCNKGVCIR